MLILSRKVGEAIRIGDGPDAVVITLVTIKSRQAVRIGITAPRNISVVRSEIAHRYQQNHSAAVGAPVITEALGSSKALPPAVDFSGTTGGPQSLGDE